MEIIKLPTEEECNCGNDTFYQTGATSDGGTIYECTECGENLFTW